jgi:hypothetical protein
VVHLTFDQPCQSFSNLDLMRTDVRALSEWRIDEVYIVLGQREEPHADHADPLKQVVPYVVPSRTVHLERESGLGSPRIEPTDRLPIGGSTPNPFGPEGVEQIQLMTGLSREERDCGYIVWVVFVVVHHGHEYRNSSPDASVNSVNFVVSVVPCPVQEPDPRWLYSYQTIRTWSSTPP